MLVNLIFLLPKHYSDMCYAVLSRAVQQNTLVMKEECESLRQKLNRAEERSVTLSTLEAECEVSVRVGSNQYSTCDSQMPSKYRVTR